MPQLELVVGGSEVRGAAPKLVLPVSEPAPGMELAEDLCTSSGVKLLARGSVLTAGSLEIIFRRHSNDPVLAGAWVRRASG